MCRRRIIEGEWVLGCCGQCALAFLGGGRGTTFSLPPAVASKGWIRITAARSPWVPGRFLSLRKGCGPGSGCLHWAAWQPCVVCRSEMTCGLMLLAATALLSGTLKSWKLLKDVHDTCVQRQESYVVNSHPIPFQNVSGFTKLSWVEGLGQLVFFFSSPGPLDSSEDFWKCKKLSQLSWRFDHSLVNLGHSWGVIALVFGRGMFKLFFFFFFEMEFLW